MPATWAHTAIAHSNRIPPALFLLEAGRQSKRLLNRQKPPRRWHVTLAIIASTGINCLLILAIGADMPWFKLVASVGMFVALSASSLIWAAVYIAEQVPIFGDHAPVFLDQAGKAHHHSCGSASIKATKQDEQIVFIECAGSYVLVPCKTLSSRAYMSCRITSGILAVVITFGYLCQYIVVPSATETQSLVWLLVQGALTLLRVLVWVFPSEWVPRIFDQKNVIYSYLRRPAFSAFQSSSGTLFGSGLDSYQSFQELELATAFSSFGVGLDEISVPNRVLGALQRVNIASTFRNAHPEYTNPRYVQDVVQAVGKKHLSWDMHPLLARKLLLQRTNDPVLKTQENSNDQISRDYTLKLLDLAGEKSWDKARPELVPLVRVTFQLEALDNAGRCVNRHIPGTGWSICFDHTDQTAGLVEVSMVWASDETTWVPFNQAIPASKDFHVGDFPAYRVTCETGHPAGPIGSGLNIPGVNMKWNPIWVLLEKVAIRLAGASKGILQRWYIQFHEDSVLWVDDARLEAPKTVAKVATPQGA